MSNDIVRVYLEQNAISHLAMIPNWQETELGAVLCSNLVEPWISPANFVEIVQATNDATRSALARTALDLCAFRRVLPSYQRLLVDTFVGILKMVDPALVRGDYLVHHAEGEARNVLAALAVMALGRPPSDPAVDDVLRSKFGSQLLHAKAVADPASWVNGIVAAADDLQLADSPPQGALDKQTIDALRNAAAAGEPAGGISQQTRTLLQKNRRKVARAYGGVELGESLLACLPLPMDFHWTFDSDKLREHWNQAFSRLGAPSPSFETDLFESLTALRRGLARGKGLLPGTISNEVVLREIERFASRGKLPNAGVALDGDHAAYLMAVNVFICDDEDLRDAARALLPLIKDETDGRWAPLIVGIGEAAEAIQKLVHD